MSIDFKKGDRVRVKARTFVDYWENNTAWTYPRPKVSTLKEGITVVHDPRDIPDDMPEIHYLRKKAESGNTDGLKCLFRVEADFEGIVIGWTYRKTGWREEGLYGDPPYFVQDKQHKVYMVVFAERERYDKPITCVVEDLELING